MDPRKSKEIINEAEKKKFLELKEEEKKVDELQGKDKNNK